MNQEKIKEKIDWWAKHNVGTRLVLVLALTLYVAVVIYGLMAEPYVTVNEVVKENKIFMYDVLIDSTSKVVIIAFAFVTLGANTVVKVAEMYFKFKKDLEG